MSESLKAPYRRELSLPLVGRQFAGATQLMGGKADPKSAPDSRSEGIYFAGLPGSPNRCLV